MLMSRTVGEDICFGVNHQCLPTGGGVKNRWAKTNIAGTYSKVLLVTMSWRGLGAAAAGSPRRDAQAVRRRCRARERSLLPRMTQAARVRAVVDGGRLGACGGAGAVDDGAAAARVAEGRPRGCRGDGVFGIVQQTGQERIACYKIAGPLFLSDF